MILAAIVLGASIGLEAQTDLETRTRSMFEELRSNALERKRLQNSGSVPIVQESESAVAAVTTASEYGAGEYGSVPPVQTTLPVANSSLIGSTGDPLPSRVFVEDTSGLGFFPDQPSGSTSSTYTGNGNRQAYPSGVGTAQIYSNAIGAETRAAIEKELGGAGDSVPQDLSIGFTPDSIPTGATVRVGVDSSLQPVMIQPSEYTSREQSNTPGTLTSSPTASETVRNQELYEKYFGSNEQDDDVLAANAPSQQVIRSGDYEGPTSDYRIQPGDIISVEVFQEPDLSRELKVAASGEITFPLLSQVMVAGKSAAQAERYVRDLLAKDFLVNPHVIITVKEFKSEQVSIQGYVNIPKLITLPPDQPLSILQAISEAGGIQRLGSPDKIELIREGESNRTFRLRDLKDVDDPSRIIYLKPNDVIYVGERGLFK